MTYKEARDAMKSNYQAEVTSGPFEGFAGIVTGMNVMFGQDHVTITATDGTVRQVPITSATRIS
jgi:transcription antitermination factor NusG